MEEDDKELTVAAKKFRDRHSVPEIVTEVFDDVSSTVDPSLDISTDLTPSEIMRLPLRSMSEPMITGFVRDMQRQRRESVQGAVEEVPERSFDEVEDTSKVVKKRRVTHLCPSPVLNAIRIREYLKSKVDSATSKSKNVQISLEDIIKEAEEEDAKRRSRTSSLESVQLVAELTATSTEEIVGRSRSASHSRLSFTSLRELGGGACVSLPLRNVFKRSAVTSNGNSGLSINQMTLTSRSGVETAALVSARNKRRENKIYKDYRKPRCGSRTGAREEREIENLLEIPIDLNFPEARKRMRRKPKIQSATPSFVKARMDDFKLKLVYDFLLRESIQKTKESLQMTTLVEVPKPSELEDVVEKSKFKSREAILQLITASVDFSMEDSAVKTIYAMVPKHLRKKFSQILGKLTQEFSIEYSDILHEVSMRSTVLPNINENAMDFKIKPDVGGKTKNYRTFLKYKDMLENSLFVSHPLVLSVFDSCKTYLPELLINFRSYRLRGTLDIVAFHDLVLADLNKSEHYICKRWYPQLLQLLSSSKVLNPREERLPQLLQCATAVIIIQMTQLIQRTINHINEVMSDPSSVPVLQFEAVFSHKMPAMEPSKEGVLRRFDELINHVNGMMANLPVMETWFSVPCSSTYIDLGRGMTDNEVFRETLHSHLDRYLSILTLHVNDSGSDFIHLMSEQQENEIFWFLEEDREYNYLFQKVDYFQNLRRSILKMVKVEYFDFGRLSQERMISSLLETADAYIHRILNEIIYKQLGDNLEICDEFNKLAKRALAVPATTEELITVEEYMIFVESKYLDQLTEKILHVTQYGTDLMELTNLSSEHLQANKETINWLQKIKPVMEECSVLIEKVKYDFESRLREKTEKLNKDLEDVCPSLEFLNNLDDCSKIYEYVLFIKTFLRRIEQFDSVVQWINKEEMLFKYPSSTYPDLDELKSIVHPLARLIFLSNKWLRTKKLWMDGSFDKLVKNEVEEVMNTFLKSRCAYTSETSSTDDDLILKDLQLCETYLTLQQTYKTKCKQQANDNNPKRFKGVVDDPDFSNWPAPLKIVSQTIDSIKDFQQHLPVISILGNPALRDRHWHEMSTMIDLNLRPTAGTSLRKVSKLDLKNFLSKFEVVSISATKELQLQQKLDQIKQEWTDVVFIPIPYPRFDIFTISNLDDIQTIVDDHIIRTLEIRRSAFIKPIKEEAKEWFDTLNQITEILELWTLLEERWLYFLNFFESQKITAEVPKTLTSFSDVNNTLTNFMKTMERDPKVLKTIGQRDVRYNIKKCYDRLEKICLNLAEFIDKKRSCFPRFYFLSNDEVLNILSEFDHPSKVQPYLLKIFAGINELKFGDDGDIVAMSSMNGEIVQFSNKISLHDEIPVEEWLLQVEEQMKLTVNFEIRKCLSLDQQSTELRSLIETRPSQVFLCIWHINWTAQVHKCLKRSNFELLQTYCAEIQKKLDESVALIISPLSKGHRQTLESLITLQSHCLQAARDFTPNTMSEFDFKWLIQPRYTWKDNVMFSMMNVSVPYNYEYLGEVSRLVITPLTLRCWATLAGALLMHLYGCIEGPAATGKTETVKDIAKMLAVQCITFNCSKFLHFSIISRFFKGLASTGAWLCFDEFNQVEVGMLSVVAQQILSISQAIQSCSKTFIFEGSEINLNSSCYICIVMNPTFGAQSILPDNLKVLFRNVIMVKPDTCLITEVLLHCYGFTDVKKLSIKLTHVYELLHTLLSKQAHYNFGLGAVRFNLLYAKELKIKYSRESEDSVLARSVLEINLPKLHSSDIALFHQIIQNLFNEYSLSFSERNVYEKSILEICKTKNLQQHNSMLSKTKEIVNLLSIGQGVLFVGESFCGKTSILQVLIDALKKESEIECSFINPKSVTIELLYGEFDVGTNVWTDGILSSIFRKCAEEENGSKKKWIIFDGPVDPVWVESINTALDSTRTLSLPSGERIKMSNSASIIFETSDLSEASPGTVSRCNVVYVDPEALQWKDIINSWLDRLPKEWMNFRSVFVAMFHWLVPPCLSFVENNCVKLLQVPKNKIIKSLTQLLSMLLSDALDENDQNYTHFLIWIQAVFLYAGHWIFGATLDTDSRVLYDEFYKNIWRGTDEDNPMPISEELEKIDVIIPADGLLFDYYYQFKAKGSWKYWPEFVRNFKIDESSNIQQVLVPTVDAARYNYVLDMHVRHGVSALLLGPTGTGKSFYVQNLLTNHLSMEKFVPRVVTLSALSTPKFTQELIISKLLKYKHKIYGPPIGKKCILFIDDVHMPLSDPFGTKPAIELLKFLIDYNFLYDFRTKTKINFQDLVFVAAMGSLTGENYNINLRFLNHFNCFRINSFSDEVITRIFSTLIMAGFRRNGFSTELYPVAVSIITSTLEIYKFCLNNLLPEPSKSHYMFSISDFARVVYGCILCKRESVDGKRVLVRLWAHEVLRVFYDRLVEEDDRQSFYNKMTDCVSSVFKEDVAEMFSGLPNEGEEMNKEALANLIFSVILDTSPEDRKYEEVPSVDHFYDAAMQIIEDYNASHQNKMSIVLFKYAVEHLSRICRILSIPGGSALLVGVGGSGRQSLTRLAGVVCRQNVFQPRITKNYSENNFTMHREKGMSMKHTVYVKFVDAGATFSEWHACLRELLEEAGVRNKPCVFIFSEGQFKEDWFLQDIHYLLSTGEVPNIFSTDQHLEVIEQVRLAAQGGNRNLDISPLAVERFFVNRCKQNVHLCLCFSPAGSVFKKYQQIFPSLIKCLTIDWFEPVVPVHIDGKTYFFEGWPEEALNNVAFRYLDSVNLSEEIKNSVVKAFKFFHVVARQISNDYLKATGRKTFVTTASYLELVQTYVQYTMQKQEQIMNAKMRYVGGLDKLDFAAEQVTVMQKDLNSLQPQLKAAAEQTEGMMKVIERETKQVEETSAQVREDEKMVNIQAKSANTLKEECETDLALAIPILEEAISALNTLKPTDITLVKSMKNPPDAIKLVMAAVCVMKDIKPEKIPDPNKPGSKMIDYWGPSKRLLGDMSFLQSLKEYDKDNIPPAIMATIRKQYLPHKDFKPQIVAKASSAAEGLCKWIIAMDMYDAVAKEVAPKKAKFDLAQKKFEATMAILIEKRNQVVELEEKLEILKEQFEEVQIKKRALEEEVKLCAGKLKKAENLISSLGGERARWTDKAKDLQHRYDCIPGDILLSCGIISYLAPYTSDFRQPQIELWKKYLRSLKIPSSEVYDIVVVLGSEVKIQHWNICRLPHDSFSVENAIIQDCSKRWSLLLDPQRQANKWIKVMEKPNDLEIIKASETHYIKRIKVCMEVGRPVLIENILEELDPLLDPILLKQTFEQDSKKFIALGDEIIEYHPSFKLYLTSSLRNPNLAAEVFNIVTVLNFALNVKGLEDKLLSMVIAKERPDLADKRHTLILENAENRKALLDIEDNILRALSECTGNILEDEAASETLDKSKLVAVKILKKQELAKKDTKVVDSFCDSYLPVAAHCAVLYYCISDLPNIEPMYQFSLDWFINKFIQSVDSAKKSTILVKRVENLKETFTFTLYTSVSRSLFDRHKLLFSFILCSSIMMKYNRLEIDELKFLIRKNTNSLETENSVPWLSNSSWMQLCCIESLPAFKGFKLSFLENLSNWKEYFDSVENFPQLPQPWDESLAPFQKLIVVKMLQPEKLIPYIVQLIEQELSSKFTSSPPFDISISYADSNCLIPLVFILSPGTDPMKSLIQFSQRMNFGNKFQSVSLGEGQEAVVTKLIKEAQVEGSWVCLQNCHLAPSWLIELEKICKNFDLSNTAHTFRLWLTSCSSELFPTYILHKGVKMVIEAPIHLQQNLLSNYLSDPIKDPEFFESCPGKDGPFTKLLYGISFFHAVIQERKTFGAIGWNIPYSFNESDFHVSITQLQMIINEYADVPYETLNYVIGECNYGGRVIDALDRKLLATLLSNYFNKAVVNNPNYLFYSGSEKTQIPVCSDYQEFLSTISDLPFIASPEMFGLHQNAGIGRDLESTGTFLKTLLLVQESGFREDTTDFYSNASLIAGKILDKLPKAFDFQKDKNNTSSSQDHSTDLFITQELMLFNTLRSTIQSTLSNLQNGVKGIFLMTSYLEDIARSLNNNQCPNIWFKYSYPSVRSLSDYMSDFAKRFEYLKEWRLKGEPPSIWLSCFFHLQGFFNICQHNHSRNHNIAADLLTFDQQVLEADSITEAPDIGVYGFGLYLEGARWDRNLKCLQEQHFKVAFDAMPIIWFKPIFCSDLNVDGRFLTPVYQTSERRGSISALGTSSNFVSMVLLDSKVPDHHWIMRGVALLCQLDS